MKVLNTERLTLRPYIESDFDDFAKLHADPKLKANTHARPLNRLQARDLFDGYRRAVDQDGFGMLNIRRKTDNADVGECGVWYRSDAAAYTLRYTIHAAHWGQGYSAEAVRAALTDVFEVQKLNSVQAIAMHHNARSIRVLEKVGFCRVSEEFRGILGFYRYLLTEDAWVSGHVLPPAHGV